MKKDLLSILACPVCRGDLELKPTEEMGGEIWSGYLTCVACQQQYPITEGIPNLLPLETRRES
jgi:uncharacterized protein